MRIDPANKTCPSSFRDFTDGRSFDRIRLFFLSLNRHLRNESYGQPEKESHYNGFHGVSSVSKGMTHCKLSYPDETRVESSLLFRQPFDSEM